MIRIILFTFFIAVITQYQGYAQVTYSNNIAKIIYTKCSSCHRDGEVGPMSLTKYEEVKAWGETIGYVTENRIMPPWQADPSFGNYLGENYLTEEEITSIKDWIDLGMPRGDVQEEPDFPDFPKGSVLGEPDLVLEMSESWLHKGNSTDDYRYFVLPTNLTEDKVIKAVEFRPGNSKIVHHALLFEDTEGVAAAKDAATPEYGFNGFGSFNDGNAVSILNQKQFPGYVPGEKPIRFPDGVGQKLHKGSDIVAQIHYAPWPVNDSDQSKINIFFMDEQETLERELQGHIMVPLFDVINEPFFISPNQEKTFRGKYTVPVDVSLVNITPHMHLLGKSWEVWLEKPGGEIVNLIKIPDWDFNWQGSYYFNRYIVAPKGSIVHAKATYDNTDDNPNNPSNPPKFVTWGEGTTDEMYYLPIGYVPYEDGDESIRFDESTLNISELTSGNMLYPIRPNPVNKQAVIGFRLDRGQTLNIEIRDINGRLVRTLRNSEFYNIGEHFINMSTSNLAIGAYTIQLQGSNFVRSQKFIKN